MQKIWIALLALGLAVPLWADEPKADKDKEEPKLEKLDLPKGAKPEEAPPAKPDEAPPAETAPAPVPDRPPLEFIIVPGEASGTPHRKGVSWATGGVIDVAQPNPTTLVVTMTGLAATNADLVCLSTAGYNFDLSQCFEVRFNSPKVRAAHLTLEGRVIGLLRTNHEHYGYRLCKKGGTAETDAATASVACGGVELVSLSMPPRSTCCGDDLSVYNHEGPFCAPVLPGKYTLRETWGFGTSHPPFFCRGASAEFAPQPSYYPGAGDYWFQHFQPFNGTASKDFGYQVTLKLVRD